MEGGVVKDTFQYLTREIQQHLEEIYHVEVSAQLSSATKAAFNANL